MQNSIWGLDLDLFIDQKLQDELTASLNPHAKTATSDTSDKPIGGYTHEKFDKYHKSAPPVGEYMKNIIEENNKLKNKHHKQGHNCHHNHGGGFPYNYYINEKNQHIIEYALAGFAKEDIQVTVNLDSINIKANGKSAITNECDVIKRGISMKTLDQTFQIIDPIIDMKNITIKFVNGLLIICMPQLKTAEPREIRIT